MKYLKSAGAFVAKIVEGVAEARRMRIAYDQLSRLSDRQLRDIGITRGDISQVVAGMAANRGSPDVRTVEAAEATEATAVEPIAA